MTKPTTPAGVILMLSVSALLALAAFVMTSPVTTGPVLVGLAVLFAVWARLSQSERQHSELWAWLQRQNETRDHLPIVRQEQSDMTTRHR